MDISPILHRLGKALDDLNAPTDCSIQNAAVNALKGSLLKKYVATEEPSPEQAAKALDKFFQCQRHLSSFDFEPLYNTRLFAVVKRNLNAFLHLGDVCGKTYNIHYNYLQDRDLGPGASVAGVTYDVYGKLFASPFTCTDESLYTLWTSSLHHTQKPADVLRETQLGLKLCSSRLSFVPKTSDVARVICTEPTGNMLAQKAVGAYLERCLKENLGIDLGRQPDVNRRLARMGSIDGRWATIDLESASDTISLDLCRSLLPKGLLYACLKSRSPVTTLPDGRSVKMKMISSMGNAFTFPLQTIIFAAICHSVRELRTGKIESARSSTFVFGDDMIVSGQDYEDALSALGMFGFLPNTTKSFGTGPFRESCGGDFYLGRNVRGVYIKRLSNKTDLYNAFNSVRAWGYDHGISVFRLLLILRRLMPRKPCYVPFDRPRSEGILTDLARATRYGTVISYGYTNPRSFGCHSWSFKRNVAVRRSYSFDKLLGQNPHGLFIAVSSGRITSDKAVAQLVPTKGLARRLAIHSFKTRWHTTTVWPTIEEWPEVERWNANSRNVLSKHASGVHISALRSG